MKLDELVEQPKPRVKMKVPTKPTQPRQPTTPGYEPDDGTDDMEAQPQDQQSGPSDNSYSSYHDEPEQGQEQEVDDSGETIDTAQSVTEPGNKNQQPPKKNYYKSQNKKSNKTNRAAKRIGGKAAGYANAALRHGDKVAKKRTRKTPGNRNESTIHQELEELQELAGIDITETTTAGAVATAPTALGQTHKRNTGIYDNIYSNTKPSKKKKSKKTRMKKTKSIYKGKVGGDSDGDG